jgi:hypothetical protein
VDVFKPDVAISSLEVFEGRPSLRRPPWHKKMAAGVRGHQRDTDSPTHSDGTGAPTLVARTNRSSMLTAMVCSRWKRPNRSQGPGLPVTKNSLARGSQAPYRGEPARGGVAEPSGGLSGGQDLGQVGAQRLIPTVRSSCCLFAYVVSAPHCCRRQPVVLAKVGQVLIGPHVAQVAEHMVPVAHGSDTGRGRRPSTEWRRPARKPPGI